MTIIDAVVVALMVAVGVALWKSEGVTSFQDWVWKFGLIAALLFGLYFFWGQIESSWFSSEDGPVNLQQGWF